MRKITTSLILCLVPILGVCQDSPPTLEIKNPEDFGINKNSPFYKNFFVQEKENLDANDGDLGEDEAQFKGVVSHLKFDEGDEIKVASEFEIPEKTRKEINDKIEQSVKQTFDSLSAEKYFQNCSENKKEVIPFKINPKEVQNEVIQDILFLRSYDVPEDTSEVFGPLVEVNSYDNDPKSKVHALALALNVKCFPYRIRVTRLHTEILTGREALKNYSHKAKGRGFIHKKARKISR